MQMLYSLRVSKAFASVVLLYLSLLALRLLAVPAVPGA
jgi:hypothetical protein